MSPPVNPFRAVFSKFLKNPDQLQKMKGILFYRQFRYAILYAKEGFT